MFYMTNVLKPTMLYFLLIHIIVFQIQSNMSYKTIQGTAKSGLLRQVVSFSTSELYFLKLTFSGLKGESVNTGDSTVYLFVHSEKNGTPIV